MTEVKPVEEGPVLARPLSVMDYATIVSRKGVRGSGIEVGDTIIILSLKVLPEKRSDPYLQRIYAVVGVVRDDVHYIPSGREDDDTKAYLIDPRCLEKESEEESLRLKGLMEAQYGKDRVN